MSELPSKPFSSPKLKDDLNDTVTASIVIQLYTQMILQQPDIKLSTLPNLPDHQKVAREHATTWNEKILPGMAKTTADIIDYANLFQSFYETLVKYAKDIANPDSKIKLLEGLKELHNTVKTKHSSVTAVVDQLNTFYTALNKDQFNFKGDYDVALVKIEGDDGEIKALGCQLDHINSAMDKSIIAMAGGALAIVGGIVMIVVGVTTVIPTLGASTLLIGGGIFSTVVGGLVETAGATDYSKQIKEQKKVTQQLAAEKQEITSLKSVNSTLKSFVSSLGIAITATQSLMGAWQALGADLNTVIEAVDRVNPSISSDYIVAELDAANSDWKVALDEAKQLQPAGKVPVKMYKDLLDAFKEMKAQG